MEDAIKYWCNTNISVRNNEPMVKNRPGKLIYQDTTFCSKSHAYADIYLLDTGDYRVYMNYGYIISPQEYTYEICNESKRFRKLSEVVDYISFYSTRNRNNCGLLIDYLIEVIYNEPWKGIKIESSKKWKSRRYPKGIEAPILSQCDKNIQLIKAIKEYNYNCNRIR